MRQFITFFNLLIFLSYFCGCEKAPSSKSSAEIGNSENNPNDDVVALLSVTDKSGDFSEILKSHDLNNSPISETSDQLAEFYNGPTKTPVGKDTDVAPTFVKDSNQSFLASTSVSNDLQQASIDSLNQFENDNAAKDAAIASLKELNQELLEEIKFLREYQTSKVQNNAAALSNETSFLSEEQQIDFENKLQIQQNQIDQLLIENKSLENKVLALTQNPYSKIKLSSPVKPPSSPTQFDIVSKTSPLQRTASLHFDAVVTSINGKNKEAFYTEFFVLSKDLEDLMINSEIQLNDYPKIDSYSELWARSRKNPFLYPGVQKKIRTTLLNEVNHGEGKRIRSDIDGAGVISEIGVGSYYIIGSAALGKIGVTWNTPINVTSGINKLSLTLANSSWSL